jgi:hypothetical protein
MKRNKEEKELKHSAVISCFMRRGDLTDSYVEICECPLKLVFRRIARYRKGNWLRSIKKSDAGEFVIVNDVMRQMQHYS